MQQLPFGLAATNPILARANALLASGHSSAWTERDLVRSFLESQRYAHTCEPLIPSAPHDTVLVEQAFKVGRADIVIYHVDGSISVIEAKDGSRGYSAVVAGIGQASLYAVQLGQSRAVPVIRRCLLWSSTGDLYTDALIEDACQLAGVVSLAMPSLRTMSAIWVAVNEAMGAQTNGSHQEG